jgi:hypothetical protein
LAVNVPQQFYLVNDTATYFDAFTICSQYGMQLVSSISLDQMKEMLAFFPTLQTTAWYDASPAICQAIDVNTGIVNLNCGTLLPVVCHYTGKRGRILIEKSALSKKGVHIIDGKARLQEVNNPPIVPKPRPQNRPIVAKPQPPARPQANNDNRAGYHAKPLIYQ